MLTVELLITLLFRIRLFTIIGLFTNFFLMFVDGTCFVGSDDRLVVGFLPVVVVVVALSDFIWVGVLPVK